MVCEELGGNSLWCGLFCYIPLGVGEELENEAAFKKKKKRKPALGFIDVWKGVRLHMYRPLSGRRGAQSVVK